MESSKAISKNLFAHICVKMRKHTHTHAPKIMREREREDFVGGRERVKEIERYKDGPH